MKITALRTFSGPYGAPTIGQTIEVPDEHGEALVAARFAKAADEPEGKPTKKAGRRKGSAAPKTETATAPEADADEVETATTEE